MIARWMVRPDGRLVRVIAVPAPSMRPRPLRSGQFFRITSPSENALVMPLLARELTRVLDEFGRQSNFTAEKPVEIEFRRGTLGLHRSSRAADIYAVGGKGIGQWAQEWNEAMRKAGAAATPEERARILEDEKNRNLGYKLYRTLQTQGRWAKPPGYPIQLFGPWTRGEGPHKAISDRMLYAHRDHIHVAK